MANALGQLPNAPLIYVLVEIRFTRVPRMDKRWEDFHLKVFSKYPISETEKLEQINIKNGQPHIGDTILRWHLLNKEKTSGIIFSSDSFIFQTTGYENSESFFDNLEALLQAFLEILPKEGVSATRLGLRYIDLLLKEKELNVEQQVIQTLQIPSLPNLGRPKALDQVMAYQTNNEGLMVIRHKQSETTDVLPADIFPTKLQLPQRLARARPEGSFVGLLDYDHYVEGIDRDFNCEDIIQLIKILQKTTSEAFKKTTTDAARAIWEGK